MLRGMPMDATDPAYKGQRDFTPLTLRFYDPFVLSFSARWIWNCPVERLVENEAGRKVLAIGDEVSPS